MNLNAQNALLNPADTIIRTYNNSTLNIAGTGYSPGTMITAWLFSEPVKIGSVIVNADGSFSSIFFIPAGIAPGKHTLQINGVNGNLLIRSLSAKVLIPDQLTPLAVPVITNSPKTPVKSVALDIKGNAEPESTVLIYLDGMTVGSAITNPSGTWSYPFNPILKEGSYQLNVRAQRPNGEISSVGSSVKLMIDNTAPLIPKVTKIPGSPTLENTPIIEGTSEPETVITLYDNGVILGTVLTSADGNWTFIIKKALDDGLHQLSVKAEDAAGNQSEQSVNSLTVMAVKPIISVSNPSPVCSPATVNLTTLTIGNAAGLKFSYYSDSAGNSPLANPELIPASGIYYIKGTNAAGGVTELMPVQVTINSLPIVNITSDVNTVVSKGSTINLTAKGGLTYRWLDASGMLVGQTAVLSIRPAQTTTYTVTASNSVGCSGTQLITVYVEDDYKTISATNIMTPNGDGVNDKWIVENIDLYPDNQVKIFNSAGRLLYTKKTYDNSWDGTYNGSPLSEGTYYYIIDFGKENNYRKGFISLLRN